MTRPIYQVKAEFFRTLGHPARIRTLELLRSGEKSVSELVTEVGLEPSHMSQQLSVLRRAGVLHVRREGTSAYYSVADERMFKLLEVAKEILTTSLGETRDLLADLASLEFADTRAPKKSSRRIS